jgi:hopanoid-associated phosphorylase
MIAAQPALLVVTGLRREADIASGDGVVTLCSGGRPELLQERLSALFRDSSRPSDAGIAAILSFGLAGGLAPHLRPGDIVIASHVVADGERHDAHTGWHNALVSSFGEAITVHLGAIAGSDSVVTTYAGKRALHGADGALAVDMESHIAAAYARRHNLPFAVIRAVSDPATRSLPDIASKALTRDGDVALGKVIGGLLRQPGQLPALIAAGRDSGRAFATLRRVRGLLGPLFGFRGADFR